jgi:hypothetical protein
MEVRVDVGGLLKVGSLDVAQVYLTESQQLIRDHGVCIDITGSGLDLHDTSPTYTSSRLSDDRRLLGQCELAREERDIERCLINIDIDPDRCDGVLGFDERRDITELGRKLTCEWQTRMRSRDWQ